MVAQTRFLRASWSSTLRLPKSSFPPRPLVSTNVEYLRRCTDEHYAWQQRTRSTLNEQPSGTFTLHDGPPYANGPLHIGHALNKITKDAICRFQVSQGKKVNFVPGWDCHGLPIEIKALQAQKRDHADTDAVSVREAARELATKTVEGQKAGMREWAIMADWDNAFKTMDRDFEVRQLEVFGKMFEKGLIYRQFKPVYWSPSSRTALAEAELEYDENHKSLAAFVRFPVEIAEDLRAGKLKGIEGVVNVVIWTTTPWTLPANKLIAVHKNMEYCAVKYEVDGGSETSIVAASRVQELEKNLGCPVEVVLSGLRGEDLVGKLSYENPFQKAKGPQYVVHADFVTDSSGTGLVHCASGHGMDDYHVCQTLGIEVFAPVDDAGTFTKEAFPERPELLEGLPVSDVKYTGSTAVLDYLEKLGLLRARHKYRHKYPIDWRTKEPVIIRATAQWFANVEGIKDAAMKAIADVKFLPESGRSRLESFIQGRTQWCISRQRAWGVPIPALYKVLDDGQLEAAMDSATIQHVINVIKERGINAWWTDAQDDPAWKPKHLEGSYVRGKDTMDVWFDSGTSWTLLSPNEDEPVADVYFEGTDQHRGWFQSSLLTHISTQDFDKKGAKAPFKNLITHGFTLDSEGRKMSKSLGNVIAPSQIMSGELLPPIKRKKQKGVKEEHLKNAAPAYDAMGSDALRLWAASSDFTRDVTIGKPVLMSVNQALHKYRVTFKWLLGVFSLPSCPPVFRSFNTLRTDIAGSRDLAANPSITNLADKLAFHRLTQVSHEVHKHYTKFEFFKGINVINRYITNDLSAFYFETLKDRIYTGHKTDCQDLQKILGLIFYEILQMLSPVCPLLVEEAWDHVPANLKDGSEHPARATWTPLPRLNEKNAEFFNQTQSLIGKIDSSIKAAQERLRTEKIMGSSLECAATLFVPHIQPRSPDKNDIDWFTSHFSRAMTGSQTSSLTPTQLNDLAGLFVISGIDKVNISGAKENNEVWNRITEGQEWWAEEKVVVTGIDGLEESEGWVVVHKAGKEKCPRCWRFQREVEEELCGRCEGVVEEGKNAV